MNESRKKGFKVDPVWVDDTTRINIFLNDGEKEYKFVNEGSFVTEENQFQLLKMIKEARDMDYLSISGSLAKELIQLTMIRYLKFVSRRMLMLF